MISLRQLVILFLCVTIAPTLPSQAAPASASGYDLIAAVNDLRRSYGLPAYKTNTALMSAAQGHSEYQASVGTWTHTGAGGSTPKSRAAAAGYGGGATIFVSENVAMGTTFSVSEVVQMWMGDAPHQNTMLSPNYTDVGAGISSDGTYTYFTLDAGYIAGQAGSAPPAASPPGTTAPPATIAIIMPVTTATPAEDGSIVHLIQPGQTLIGIAEAYQIPLGELLALNNLSLSSVIYVNQRLTIRGPQASPTPTVTSTRTPLPTSTLRPTRTPRPTATLTRPATATPKPEASPTSPPALADRVDISQVALGGIAVLILSGTILILYGVLRKGRGG